MSIKHFCTEKQRSFWIQLIRYEKMNLKFLYCNMCKKYIIDLNDLRTFTGYRQGRSEIKEKMINIYDEKFNRIMTVTFNKEISDGELKAGDEDLYEEYDNYDEDYYE